MRPILFTNTNLQEKTMRQLLLSLPSRFSLASALKALLGFLRLARNYVLQFPGRRAILRQKLRVLWWWCFGLGKPDMLRRSKPPDLSKASPYSVSRTSTVLRECVVAASMVPGTAIHSKRQERAESALTASALSTTPQRPQTPTNVSHSGNHAQPNPPPPSERGIIIHPGSGYLGTVNTQNSGSGRFSVVRDSCDSIHDQPLRLSTATHFQFGYLPDPSQPRDQLSGPPSSTNALPSTTLYQLHRPESTDLPSLAHGDMNLSPINRPSTSFYTYESLGSRLMDGNRRRRSSNSMVLNVQNASTELVPISSSVYALQVTAEPFDTDTPTAYSSPVSATVDLYGEAPIQPSNNFLPEGRSVQLINSDQVPRYTKNITM